MDIAIRWRPRRRDNQRSRVYAWERKIKNRDEVAVNTIEEVARYASRIWRSERGRYGLAKTRVPEFMPARRGQRNAIAFDHHVISLPRGWARTPRVILHELAHRLTPANEAHGPRFVGVLIGLLARHAGYNADALMAEADAMGVKYHVRSIGAVPVSSLPDRVVRVLKESGPLPEMWIASELDCSYMQVRGAALQLARTGRARWFRKRLTLTEQLPAWSREAKQRRRQSESVAAE